MFCHSLSASDMKRRPAEDLVVDGVRPLLRQEPMSSVREPASPLTHQWMAPQGSKSLQKSGKSFGSEQASSSGFSSALRREWLPRNSSNRCVAGRNPSRYADVILAEWRCRAALPMRGVVIARAQPAVNTLAYSVDSSEPSSDR